MLLLEYPPEVLVMILFRLPASDINAFRRTCRLANRAFLDSVDLLYHTVSNEVSPKDTRNSRGVSL